MRALAQVPPGVQCFVGEEARRRRAVEARVLAVFDGWEYEEIIPPLLDYADVFASRELAQRTYTFIGPDGAHLALRPDFTSLLARIAAGRLADREPPIRLYYSGEVLRYEAPRPGRQGELYQMGLEHLGGNRREADVEVLAVAAECLESLGVRDWVFALGHVGVFDGIVSGVPEGPAKDALRERLEAKDEAGVAEGCARLGLGPAATRALRELCSLAGGVEAIARVAPVVAGFPAAQAALRELGAVVDVLVSAGLGERLTVDAGEVSGLGYYTGLVFRVYARGLGFEVGAGGRYDGLLARFGRPLPAIGFMLGLDRLGVLLDRQHLLARSPREAAVVAEGGDLTERLARARGLRAAGRRVRLGGGDRVA